MHRPCLSCSRDVLFTFLESVTAYHDTRLLHTVWLRRTRSLSSAISRRSMLLDSSKSENESRRQDDSAVALSNIYSTAQDISRISNDTTKKQGSVDMKSWKQQRQLFFRDLKSAQNKQLEQNTDARNAMSNKSVDLSDVKDDGTYFKFDTTASELEPNEAPGNVNEVYISQQEQDSGYNNRKSQAPSIHAISIGRKEDRQQSQESLTSDLDDTQTSNLQAIGMAVSEASVQTSSALPRKKDRWRNRSAESPENHIADSERNSFRDRKDLTGKKPGKSTADIPDWRVHKQAVKAKLSGQAWNPLKRLSPDAQDGVRQLHSENSVLWSTENLANHFQISPDAIRRILKSRWTPTDREREQRQERWVRRGETIWDRYVELGYKAPRKWRGLNPMPAARSLTAHKKSEFKPEEWSQDQNVEHEPNDGLGPSLGDRIM